MSDQVMHEEEFEEVGLGRYIAIAAVVAVVVAVAAFFAGRASGSSSGPATLAAAVSQARSGKLPCGASAQSTPQPGVGRPDASFLVAAVCNGGTGFRGAGSGGRGFAIRGSGTAGRLSSVNGSTLTIQGRSGTQKVKLGASAEVRRYAAGSRSDLKPGDSVIVSGRGSRQTVTVLPAATGGGIDGG